MSNVELTDKDKMAFQLFLAAYSNLTRKIARDLTKHTELTLEQYDVLVTLEYEPEQKLRLSDLAEKILLSRSGLSRMIDRLEAKGWVKRHSCELDRRGAYAVLTPEGKQMREDSWPVLEASMKRHFRDQIGSCEDVEHLGRTCRILAFGNDPSGRPWDQG